jgi:alpha-beta hydrolase superfamily lysophospholipase
MLSDSGHLCGNREFVSAAHARGYDIIGGREQGCGSHDTPLSHMGEGSAFVGVAKVEGLDCSRAD